MSQLVNVAIVGKPNVGKSTLFNRMIEKKISIVDETSGVTRDRIIASCTWLNFDFNLIDTGGLVSKKEEKNLEFFNEIKIQTQFSISQSIIIIFVVNLKDSISLTDLEIAKMLHRTKKPVILCVNKCDCVGALPNEFYEFYKLGFKNMFAVSAIHGYGIGELLDCVVTYLPKNQLYVNEGLKLALIGRPNVGKSSILNKIFGNERTIVSKIPGTTRDAIDVNFKFNDKNFILIDTAGIIKNPKKKSNLDFYSLTRTYLAIEQADICLVVIDISEGLTEFDVKILGYVDKQGKGCLIVANKFDLIDNKLATITNFNKKLKNILKFMAYAEPVFVSAKTGQNLNKIFLMSELIQQERTKRLSTGVLNSWLNFCISKKPPATFKGKQLKIYYITQIQISPPTFALFVNCLEGFHFSYKRYLENQLRLAFNFKGTPIKLVFKINHDKI